MNGISMNMKCACGAHHVAETAALAISEIVFIAEPFGSAFFVILDQASAREGIHTFASRVILGAKRRESIHFIPEFKN